MTIWGCRGSLASPGPETVRFGGQTSCVTVHLSDGSLLILDAGTGIRPLGMALGHDHPKRIDIFITHLHTDHIEGLRFFDPIWVRPSSSTCGDHRHPSANCGAGSHRTSLRRSSPSIFGTSRPTPSSGIRRPRRGGSAPPPSPRNSSSIRDRPSAIASRRTALRSPISPITSPRSDRTSPRWRRSGSQASRWLRERRCCCMTPSTRRRSTTSGSAGDTRAPRTS